jgi:hypothetical protein
MGRRRFPALSLGATADAGRLSDLIKRVARWICRTSGCAVCVRGPGPVAELVGIEGGVVSGVFNLESSGVEAPDRRPRHEEHYHEA